MLHLLCIIPQSYATIVISTNTTWNTNQFVNDDIAINPGATLTISNCTIVFVTGKYILVESNLNNTITTGARLVLNSCTLTSGTSLATPNISHWKGIYVVGNNSNASQNGVNTKVGKLIANNSVIKRAQTAVSNFYLTGALASVHGGIIQATNTTFSDNQTVSGSTYPSRFIHMRPYQNFNNTYTPSNYASDLSFFKGCQFILNPHATQNLDAVFLNNVHGIKFYGNTFTIAGAFNAKEKGINMNNASAVISNYDCNNITPCVNYPGNNFTNLLYGIHATTSSKLYAFNNTFTNNAYGIVGAGILAPYICKNNFINTVTHPIWNINDPTNGAIASHIGISLSNTNLYTIMENTFKVLSPFTPATCAVLGLGVVNCGSLENEVYKNTFQSTSAGIDFDGHNREPVSPYRRGAKPKCNNFSNPYNTSSFVDLFVGGNNQVTALTQTDGIPLEQGEYVNGIDNPSNPSDPYYQYKTLNNTFASTSTGAVWVGGTIGNFGKLIHYYTSNSNYLPHGSYTSSNHPNQPSVITGAEDITKFVYANIPCPSKICVYPCQSNERTLSASAVYNAIKQAILDSLVAQQGTVYYDQTLIQYQTLVKAVIQEYLGEPLEPEAEIQHDALLQLLSEVTSNNYGTALKMGANQNLQTVKKLLNNLIEYDLMKAQLLATQYEYSKIITMLESDYANMDLTTNQKSELIDLIAMYTIKNELHKGASFNEFNTEKLKKIRQLADDFNNPNVMATPVAKSIMNEYTNELFYVKSNAQFALSSSKLNAPLEKIAKNKELNNSNNIYIFPNPANKQLNLGTGKKVHIIILNALGIKQIALFNTEANTIDIEKLPNGTYTIDVLYENGKRNYTKFIKQ